MSTANQQKPPKWWQVYSGDAENKLFRELSRAGFNWRTSKALASAINLPLKKVEEIVEKYLQMGVIRQHSKEPEKFQYWEMAENTKQSPDSIAAENQKKRVEDAVVAAAPDPSAVP